MYELSLGFFLFVLWNVLLFILFDDSKVSKGANFSLKQQTQVNVISANN